MKIKDLEVATVELIRRFEKIEPKKWDLVSSNLEIADQLGDISDIVLRIEHYKVRKNKTVNEFLEDLKDEICDVIFMLIRITNQIGISFMVCFKYFKVNQTFLNISENTDFKYLQNTMTDKKLKISSFERSNNVKINVNYLNECFGMLSKYSLDYYLTKNKDTGINKKISDIKKQIFLMMYYLFFIADFYSIDCDKEYLCLIERANKKLIILGV